VKRLSLALLLPILVVGLALAAFLFITPPVESETIKNALSRIGVYQASAPTEIRVYALARGGRFIGDDIGGAQVTLRDSVSGEFLASGRTRGGSGVADLMTVERARTEPISTQDAAVFTTTLQLDEPRLIQFEAYAPLGAPSSANHVTTTEWVVPAEFGENKIILEIPGLNVEVVDPPTHFLPKIKPPLDIKFRVNVTMICGCPIGPGLAWQPQNYEVKAMVHKPDGTSDLIPLEYDPTAPDTAPSQFIGTYMATQSGVYDAVVFGHQIGVDNAGSDRVTFILP